MRSPDVLGERVRDLRGEVPDESEKGFVLRRRLDQRMKQLVDLSLAIVMHQHVVDGIPEIIPLGGDVGVVSHASPDGLPEGLLILKGILDRIRQLLEGLSGLDGAGRDPELRRPARAEEVGEGQLQGVSALLREEGEHPRALGIALVRLHGRAVEAVLDGLAGEEEVPEPAQEVLGALVVDHPGGGHDDLDGRSRVEDRLGLIRPGDRHLAGHEDHERQLGGEPCDDLADLGAGEGFVLLAGLRMDDHPHPLLAMARIPEKVGVFHYHRAVETRAPAGLVLHPVRLVDLRTPLLPAGDCFSLGLPQLPLIDVDRDLRGVRGQRLHEVTLGLHCRSSHSPSLST